MRELSEKEAERKRAQGFVRRTPNEGPLI